MAVKLPDFWLADPELWFTQEDSMFRRANIKCSLTKYDYCLQKLPYEVLQSVRAGVVDDPYEQLEEKLTSSFQKSPWERTFELLDMPDLGDCRPLVLMDAMLALQPDDVEPNRLFLALFLRRLPADVRDHLAAQDLKTPADIAAVENRLFDAVAAVAARRSSRDTLPANRRRSPSRQDGRHEGRKQTPGSHGDSGGLCFYHDRFGKWAAKCEPPCTWPLPKLLWPLPRFWHILRRQLLCLWPTTPRTATSVLFCSNWRAAIGARSPSSHRNCRCHS
jgi:hypothetical protein